MGGSKKAGLLALLAGGLALSAAVPAQAQTAPPEGVAEGQGAGFPKGHYAELEALPDWGGIWFLERGGARPAPPELKGQYLADYQAWRQQVQANDGVVPRARSNCSPPGMPGIMRLAQYPYEFIFAPGRVTINQEAWMQTRTIWTDGRTHPEDLDPTFMGHSIGHWEGDTLVVDTVGILDELEITDGAGHSPQFHLVERIHLDPANPDLLVNEMRMEDPEALAAPYEVKATYRRDRYGELIEFQCSENNRNPVDENGHTQFD
ncbi:conserved hypothetical protein [Altererythrobacter sp. B11]|uniref:hypothetical protein n=1 Tax=Altererythrobacter sp. B11 TaxID=2060312 RepID=UPI000DC6F3D6|nr:hypothetical protein [Altererythrobacter sp. B11]BBC74382.1 conserved hypothetical protein [Altererythrobacter sp. B11]